MQASQIADKTKTWDAGDAGCGRLILGLKHQVDRLQKGEYLSVTARDPAAHIDLAHWCHMTGHVLVSVNHPTYVLKKGPIKGNEEK